MYEHIIVPFDGTKAANRAVLLGAEISTMADADLVVATSSGSGRRSSVRKAKDRAVSFSDDRVTVWLEPARSLRAAFETMVAYRPNSLICMYTHARTGVLRTVYGNLAQTLLRVVDAPLLLIGPEWAESSVSNLNHLIVCVDGSAASEAAISLAGDWADMTPLGVTVLHVRTSADEGEVDLDRLAAPLESRCEIVDKLVVDNADVVDGVLDVVRHSIEPIVVMATHARTGVDRLRHGSIVAELSTKCPVPILVQRGVNAELEPDVEPDSEPVVEPDSEPVVEPGSDDREIRDDAPNRAAGAAVGLGGAAGGSAGGAGPPAAAEAAAAAVEAALAAADAAASAAEAASAAAAAAAAAEAAAVAAAAAADRGVRAGDDGGGDDIDAGEVVDLVATIVDVDRVADVATLVGVPEQVDVDQPPEADPLVSVDESVDELDVEPQGPAVPDA
jgi:nucleotide-binding universal stress UspA family protein